MSEDIQIDILRRLGNLEKHVINLIGHLEEFNAISESKLAKFLNVLEKPIYVNDIPLRNLLDKWEKLTFAAKKTLDTTDVHQTYAEIKFIGKRLFEIEQHISQMKNEGVRRKILLEVHVDGNEIKNKSSEDFLGAIDEVIPNADESLQALLNTLLKKEATCLIYRLGLLGAKKDETLDQLGTRIGVSRERVRQIIKKALLKCRDPSRKNLVDKIQHKELRKLIIGDEE